MNRWSLLLVIIGLCSLAGGALWVASSPSNPHDFAEQCETCHLKKPQRAGEELIFNYDIDYLCNYCHEIPGTNSHPSLMVPSMPMPAGFPLDWQGRMTCATCHDPHQDNWGVNPALLRGDGVAGRTFCALCHSELQQPGSQHRIAEIVHAKNALTPTREEIGSILDRISLECISCHDGAIGKAINYRLAGEETLTYAGRSMNHPIGMNYSNAAQYNDKLHPVESLSPLITLVDGKVGCSSCHNQYSHELTMLAMSNKGSGLCMQCHNM
jgi:predicted CXXCH cytochrome family protein